MVAFSKSLFFISSTRGIKKLSRLISASKEVVVIAANYRISRLLHNKNIHHKIIWEYSPPADVISKNGLKWIKTLQNAELKGNKTIKELFTYERFSLWWFIDYWLYDSSFFFNPSLSDMVWYIETAMHLADTERPLEVFIIGDETIIAKIVELVFTNRKIPVMKINGAFTSAINKISKISLRLKPSIKLLLMCGRLLIRKVAWEILKAIYRPKYASTEKFQHHILMVSADYWRKVRDPTTLEVSMGDGYLHTVVSELRKNPRNMISFVGVVRGYETGVRVMWKRLSSNGVRYKPFENYLRMSTILKVLRTLWRKRAEWKGLICSNSFKRLLYYKSIALHDLLFQRFSFFLERFPLVIMITIEIAKNLIKTEKPDVVVISEETVMDGRALVIASKIASVPIVCIQHGIIGQAGKVDCEHDISDIGPHGEVHTPYCPIPDKMAVYGEIYKNKCIEVSKYPEKILEITGSPRYDILAHFDKIYKREEILVRLSESSGTSLDPKKRIILLLTQPLPSSEENELLLEYTYRAIKKLDNVQLIVKVHPGEPSIKPHRKLAQEADLDGVIIIKDFDTFELLYICDLAISAFSTTQLEALALGKPTISVDVFRRGYWAGLDEDGAIVSVSDEDSLAHAIHSSLFNLTSIADLTSRIANFKRKHLCNVDGLATKRVAGLIDALLRGPYKFP